MRNKKSLRDLQRSVMVVALSLAAAAAQAQVVSGSSSDASAPDYTVHPGDTMMGGHVVIPQSSIENPGDVGLRAHTNTRIFVPQRGTQAQPGIPAGAGVVPPPNSATVQPVAGLFAETPASLACVYAQVTPTAGCNASTLTTNATGGAGRVVIVDAYDDPSAVADLQAYSTQFGLPPPILSVIYASGTQPAGNIGWAQEESLDLDMVHAMAPGAQIVLVEAASNSFTDLFQAEDVATAAAAATEGEVTNSWGGGEFLGETSYDTHFAGAKVVYFASTGDAPASNFPLSLQTSWPPAAQASRAILTPLSLIAWTPLGLTAAEAPAPIMRGLPIRTRSPPASGQTAPSRTSPSTPIQSLAFGFIAAPAAAIREQLIG